MMCILRPVFSLKSQFSFHCFIAVIYKLSENKALLPYLPTEQHDYLTMPCIYEYLIIAYCYISFNFLLIKHLGDR